MNEIRVPERKIEVLSQREEFFWQQRSRMEWLAAGDRNTKYCHGKASNQRNKNEISRIKVNNGFWLEKDEDILNLLENYFTSIFQSTYPSDAKLEVTAVCVESRISMEDKVWISKPFTEIELFRAFCDMGATKALRPNDFQVIFYKKFQDVMGSHVTSAVLKVLNESKLVVPINSIHIVLIPKKSLELVFKSGPLAFVI